MKASDYGKIKVRLSDMLAEPEEFWGQRIDGLDWTEFEVKRLLAEARLRRPVQIASVVFFPQYLIVGVKADGSEELGSVWSGAKAKYEMLRSMDDAAASERTTPGRKAGSGIGLLVAHLRLEEGMEYDDIVSVLQRCNLEWVRRVVDAWGENGRERARNACSRGKPMHELACKYCRDGLPSAIEGLVASVRRPQFK